MTRTKRDTEFPLLHDALSIRIVETTARTVRDHYIFPEDAGRMSALLLSKLNGGAFSGAATVSDLARQMTDVLQTVREDLHLAVLPWLSTADGSEQQDGMLDGWRAGWQRRNYEFRAVEVLLGNVGYLDLRGFPTARAAGPTAAAAMQFLANTDALIFDLRDNGGGEDLVCLLMSYLFAEPKHVHTARYRDHDEQSWTYAYVPGPRFPDHPAYVLSSRSTFSAGEDFTYNLQQLGRVIVVGEQTRGGAHPVEFYRFPELYLELMIPNAYSVNPVTENNWEESGVIPDIAVPADDALAAAHEHALTTLINAAQDDATRRHRTWALDTLQARKMCHEVDRRTLAAYAGEYARSVVVELQRDTLRLAWGGRRAHRLTPVAEHRFEFDRGTQRITFHVEGDAVSDLLWETEDGDAWTMERVPSPE